MCIRDSEEDPRAPLPRRRSHVRLRPVRSRSPHRDSPEPLDEDPPPDGETNESAAPESSWPSGNPLDDMETNVLIPDEFNIDNFSDPEYLHEYAAGRRTIRRCWKNFKTLLPPLSYVPNDEIRRAHNDRSHAGVPFMWRIALREWNYRMHSIGARLSEVDIGYTWYDLLEQIFPWATCTDKQVWREAFQLADENKALILPWDQRPNQSNTAQNPSAVFQQLLRRDFEAPYWHGTDIFNLPAIRRSGRLFGQPGAGSHDGVYTCQDPTTPVTQYAVPIACFNRGPDRTDSREMMHIKHVSATLGLKGTPLAIVKRNNASKKQIVLDLSLIHISEPTRPY